MYNILIFGYNFTHKKSEDFIHILEKNSIKIVAFVGANAVDLKINKKIYTKNIPRYAIYHPKELCKKYNIPFFENAHNSENIKEIVENTKANIGIISGARIIKDDIINLFQYGVVNFHPGKIPIASGLDGLFWSIYKGVYPCVTTHLIDKKIDAGEIIFTKEVIVDENDRIEDIKHRISLTENSELEKLCLQFLKQGRKIKSVPINNYIFANKSMNVECQKRVISKFEEWKRDIVSRYLCKN
jgi:methionyl-tRNA formyltransferase